MKKKKLIHTGKPVPQSLNIVLGEEISLCVLAETDNKSVGEKESQWKIWKF